LRGSGRGGAGAKERQTLYRELAARIEPLCALTVLSSMRRSILATGFLVVLSAAAFGGDEPTAEAPAAELKPGSVRGLIRSTEGRPVSWVLVQCLDEDHRRRYADVTGEDGTFHLHGVPGEFTTLGAYVYGNPSAGDPIKQRVRVGTQDVVFVVDLGEQLVIRAEQGRFAPGDGLRDDIIYMGGYPPSEARLYVEVGKQTLRWTATVEDGALRFRRLKTGHPWTLYIPWSRRLKGTYLGSGAALAAGERTVTLEPGRRITGTVSGAENTKVPSGWAGPDFKGIVARRGPVSVGIAARFPWGGSGFASPPLPSGRWEVSVYNVEKGRGFVGATVQVAAGEEVLLKPVPSREAYDRARWGER